MKRKHRRLVQVLAIVLVVLLVGGVIVSALIAALAEGQTATTPERDRYELAIEYIDDRGALHIGQPKDVNLSIPYNGPNIVLLLIRF